MVNSKAAYHFKNYVKCHSEPLESTPSHFCSTIIFLPFPSVPDLPHGILTTPAANKLLHSIYCNLTHCAACTAHVSLLAFLTLTLSDTQ